MYKEFTGHMYRGSAIETASDCGNCDGAKCETCEPSWVIETNDGAKRFYDLEEAKAYEAADVSNKLMLLNIPQNLFVSKFFKGWEQEGAVWYHDLEDEDVNFDISGCYLYATYKAHTMSSIFGKKVRVRCNPDSPIYNEVFARTAKYMRRYAACPCADKVFSWYGNCCGTLRQCNDFYHMMKCRQGIDAGRGRRY